MLESLPFYNQLPATERQAISYSRIQESEQTVLQVQDICKRICRQILPVVLLLQYITDLLELWALLK